MTKNEVIKKATAEQRGFLDDLYDLLMGADFITIDSFREKYLGPWENTENPYAIPFEVDTGKKVIRFGLHELHVAVNTTMADE